MIAGTGYDARVSALVGELLQEADRRRDGGDSASARLVELLVRAGGVLTDGFFSPWMTTAEAARYTRCSSRTLEGYRISGGGPAYHRHDGRLVFYHKDDLDAWRRQGRAENTGQERHKGVPLAGIPV